MTDLDQFFLQQRRRVRAYLETRCGKLADVEDHPAKFDRASLLVEHRGNAAGHASGRKKKNADDQVGRGGVGVHHRRENTWSDFERRRVEKDTDNG